jgi:hypothetical protein
MAFASGAELERCCCRLLSAASEEENGNPPGIVPDGDNGDGLRTFRDSIFNPFMTGVNMGVNEPEKFLRNFLGLKLRVAERWESVDDEASMKCSVVVALSVAVAVAVAVVFALGLTAATGVRCFVLSRLSVRFLLAR